MIDFHRFFPIEVDLVISFSFVCVCKREREIQTHKLIERYEEEREIETINGERERQTNVLIVTSNDIVAGNSI